MSAIFCVEVKSPCIDATTKVKPRTSKILLIFFAFTVVYHCLAEVLRCLAVIYFSYNNFFPYGFSHKYAFSCCKFVSVAIIYGNYLSLCFNFIICLNEVNLHLSYATAQQL